MAKALTTDYTFYTSSEYWAALISRIDQTRNGGRVALMTMDFDTTEPIIETLVQALLRAMERGVQVWLTVDARPLLFDPRSQRLGPLWRGNSPKAIPTHLSAIQTINAQKYGHAVIINKPARPFTNPFAGRSHIKLALVNNEVFIGSCNLNQTTILNIMVGWEDKQTADYLYSFVQDVTRYEHVGRMLSWHDQKRELTATSTLFFDAGKPKQSIIFEQALRLIDEAKEMITLTCQFFPNGVTAKHLIAARERGVQVKVIFAHPSNHSGLYGLGQHYNVWREKRRVPKELFENALNKDVPLMHAKLLVTDAGTMIGSHNYVRAGVSMGTAEIALLSSDATFAQAALSALNRQLATFST